MSPTRLPYLLTEFSLSHVISAMEHLQGLGYRVHSQGAALVVDVPPRFVGRGPVLAFALVRPSKGYAGERERQVVYELVGTTTKRLSCVEQLKVSLAVLSEVSEATLQELGLQPCCMARYTVEALAEDIQIWANVTREAA